MTFRDSLFNLQSWSSLPELRICQLQGCCASRGGKMTPSLEQKTSTDLKVSFTHQGNFPVHLLQVPCAVSFLFGSIKIRYIYILLVKKCWKKAVDRNSNMTWECELLQSSVFQIEFLLSYSWQKYLDGNTKTTDVVRCLASILQEHSWGCGQLQIHLPWDRKESTACCCHQHTLSVQIDESNVESVRNFHK